MTTKEKKDRICLGAIVGVHGIRGELKVKSWTASDQDIGNYGLLENEDGTRSFELKVVGRSKELLRCKIKGVEDRNAAEALIGTALYVERAALPALEEEEYYQADLIGLKVVDQSSGCVAGKVVGFYNFGAGDILLDNGSGLSRQSRVTARAMTQLISYGWKSPRMPEWIVSFPISATDGTMSKRRVAPGQAYIKTGLMNTVKSAGGIIQARSGKRYAVFAVVQGKKATETDAPIDRLIEWVYFNG